MVIDTSAVIAILLSEREAATLAMAIATSERRLLGAPTLGEATTVMLARKGKAGVIALDALLARLDIEVVDMTTVAGEFARDAYARFGKGAGSPGVLDYGDTLSYGVAKAADEPLLFTGTDFTETDILPAL
jgi:ribonuclease VapC